MMRKVQRDEVMDYVTYSEQRDVLRAQAMAAKDLRRIHVGLYLTFLFENNITMRYQVHEMLRIEQLVKEKDIQYEIDTYNEVIGDEGEIGCTLLIEVETPEERAVRLTEWLALPEHIYVKTEDGQKVYCQFDARQVGEDRVSSVQYIKFKVGARAPIAVGADLPALDVETTLSADQRAALQQDLDG